jgi:predicted RNA-binding Zn-ribbon protein involved in translation (DUF1610 family)
MSEMEVILRQDSGVKAYEGEHPPSVGLKADAFADVGTLILTNQRLAYINKGSGARGATYALGGPLVAWATEKSVSKAELDDITKYKGSYSIRLQEITHVEAARHMGAAYLRVDNQNPNLKPAHSFIFGGGFSNDDDWVKAINTAIVNVQSPQSPSPPPSIKLQTNPPSPTFTPVAPSVQPQPPAQPATSMPKESQTQINCPSCGQTLSQNAKFCSSCGSPVPPPKPTPKFCAQCGAPVSPNAKFCASCGTKLNNNV